MQVVLDKGFVECLIQLKRSDDRKAVNVALTRFSKNPSNPGLNLECLRDVRDRNFWSMRVNRDVRVILCRGRETWLVLYVDHHDAAYRWAERVKVRRHSATGGLQIVHTEEVYKEEVFQHPSPQPDDGLLSPNLDEEYILSLGIPEEALPAIEDLLEDMNKLEKRIPDFAQSGLAFRRNELDARRRRIEREAEKRRRAAVPPKPSEDQMKKDRQNYRKLLGLYPQYLDAVEEIYAIDQSTPIVQRRVRRARQTAIKGIHDVRRKLDKLEERTPTVVT